MIISVSHRVTPQDQAAPLDARRAALSSALVGV
jgi:hypothetical protein